MSSLKADSFYLLSMTALHCSSSSTNTIGLTESWQVVFVLKGQPCCRRNFLLLFGQTSSMQEFTCLQSLSSIRRCSLHPAYQASTADSLLTTGKHHKLSASQQQIFSYGKKLENAEQEIVHFKCISRDASL